MSTQAPLRTALSDTYPNPSNAVMRTGMGALWDFVKAKLGTDVLPVTLASASSVAIGAAASTNVTITGTTTITSFDTAESGIERKVLFSGAVPMTHNATSLILLGGLSRTTSAGDSSTFLSLGSGNWREVGAQKANGAPVPINGLVDISGAAAGQIKFPVTQNSSADANTLDDYEEGTFTPTVTLGGGAVGATYGTQVGRYTKTGNRVSFSIRLTLTNKGSSTGALLVAGLPFATNTNVHTALSIWGNGLGSGVSTLMAFAVSNSTTIQLWRLGAGTATGLVDTDIGNSSDFIISGQYEV